MNLHTYVFLCLMLYIILNNTIHGVEPRWREKQEERQWCKYFNASCVTFFTFETDAAGKYLSPKKSTEGFPFNHAICVYKYLNRCMAILNMTVWPISILTLYLL